jgi:tRNA dimethylallyltransferase
VIAIFGPTASGKTAVSEVLADRLPGEVVSADAMQVYGGLPILTNQSERPSHLTAIWPLDHEGSVAEYHRLAHAAIDDIVRRKLTAVVAGGTGLYLRAALSDLDLPPAPPPGTRERFEAFYDELGPDGAHEALAEQDPEAAAGVHPNDRRRVVRGLELAESGSSLRGAGQLWASDTRHATLLVGLHVPVEELSRRIDERTAAMWERGVEAEVAAALEEPVSTSAATIFGLREIAELPRETAQAAIAARTRKYAAYQRKWMRRIPDIVTVAADRPPAAIADEVLQMARTR